MGETGPTNKGIYMVVLIVLIVLIVLGLMVMTRRW